MQGLERANSLTSGDRRTVDGRAMVRKRGQGAEVEQLLEKVSECVRDVFDSQEETWYARKCRDGSVL